MPSMRSIKRRKESVTSTQQITKAMKLVSTVKLQKARARVEANSLYFEALYRTICSILAKTWDLDNRFLKEDSSGKKVVIVLSSNRGLAGGYNSNIVKLVDSYGFDKENTLIFGIGRKGIEGLKRKGYHVEWDESDIINEPLYNDCIAITKTLMERFNAGEIDEIYVAYTDFRNTVTHIPTLRKMIPLSKEDFAEDMAAVLEESEQDQNLQMNYGMSNSGIERDMVVFGSVMDHYHPEEKILNEIIPKYMTNLIYGAFLEAIASENAARMQAMDSATENAQDMISTLELQYNRARQGSITQELTEIVAGAEALT
ncbi:MAG: ATP synthase F1 subunit gamma [Eubacterium sp.]|nr:ATP synthase F1 subunit gamma [Eubacterium sp.]